MDCRRGRGVKNPLFYWTSSMDSPLVESNDRHIYLCMYAPLLANEVLVRFRASEKKQICFL
jgi:hypothetical protein